MKTSLFTAFLATGCLSALATLNRADVAADPAWLAHLDCDRLRPTAVGQYILSEMEKPEAKQKLAGFQAMFGFDLRTQLHALTLYSVSGSPEDAVLLVYADFDSDRLITLAQAAPDSQQTNYKKHIIYNWIDEKKPEKNGVKPRVYAAIAGKRVILGQNEHSVSQGLDVLDGASNNLAKGTAFPQLGGAADASIIEAAARKTDLLAVDPQAAILKLAKTVRIQVATSPSKATANLVLEAENDEVAGHITTVAQGLIALMKLQKEKPEALKIADGLSLKQNGAALEATLSLPPGEIVDMMKADAARKAQKEQK